jgi:hypothetical protein
MLLRHATLIRNLPGIERRGLLCGKSQGQLPVVWLHTPDSPFGPHCTPSSGTAAERRRS